jgi:hypothetical protein
MPEKAENFQAITIQGIAIHDSSFRGSDKVGEIVRMADAK